MAKKAIGTPSVRFEKPPVILEASSIVGKKEGEGPFGKYFDRILSDHLLGEDSWEKAEQHLQKDTAKMLMDKLGPFQNKIRYVVAGDLLGQLMASSFGTMDYKIPLFGVYGACSTMGESLGLAAALVDGGYADAVMALTSSHFASAEKQFRFPLGYSNQRPKAATWTVTGSGAVCLADPDCVEPGKGMARVVGMTTGKVTDYGVKDNMNMGACMAPAAADVIYHHLEDFGTKPQEYDRIVTGDLGLVGKDILIDLMRARGYDISKQYMDCGVEIFGEGQNVQAGGSGCGCSAVMLTGFMLKELQKNHWKRILFVPTGALISPVSFNEGDSVPGIAHGVVLEAI